MLRLRKVAVAQAVGKGCQNASHFICASAFRTLELLPPAKSLWQYGQTRLVRISDGAKGTVAQIDISESRLKEFMKAEISHFAQMAPEPVKLCEIVHASDAEQAAGLIHKMLPRAFATRIRHIEQLPNWDQIEALVEIHNQITQSFHNLRLVEHGSDLSPLTAVIRDLRNRHKAIVPLLGKAMAQLTGSFSVEEEYANQWLDRFLLARISTEMLTAHYIGIVDWCPTDEHADSRIGIVDRRCNPGKICQEAAHRVAAEHDNAVTIDVSSNACTASQEAIAFSFLPKYLLLLIEELLKNSAQATLRRLRRSEVYDGVVERDCHPIRVTVTADQRKVMIKISDRAGGMSNDFCEGSIPHPYKRWEYGCGSADGALDSWMEPLAGIGIKPKFGMGIRLIRLYAEYLGGTLHLLSLPSVGTDAYLVLNRVDA